MSGLSPKLDCRLYGVVLFWPIRLFAFFIVCTEVNAYLAMKYFLNNDETFVNFGKIWLRHWLTTPILMERHMAVQKIP